MSEQSPPPGSRPLRRTFDATLVVERSDIWVGYVVACLIGMAVGTVFGVAVGAAMASVFR